MAAKKVWIKTKDEVHQTDKISEARIGNTQRNFNKKPYHYQKNTIRQKRLISRYLTVWITVIQEH